MRKAKLQEQTQVCVRQHDGTGTRAGNEEATTP